MSLEQALAIPVGNRRQDTNAANSGPTEWQGAQNADGSINFE